MYIRACKLSYKSADSLVQVCNLVCDLLTRSLITQVSHYPIFLKAIVPESLRDRSAYSLFCQLLFDAILFISIRLKSAT